MQDELAKGDVILIDWCESEESKQSGRIEVAIHAPRGMLEFYADPAMLHFKPELEKTKRIILYFAYGSRSALAVTTLKEMGFTNEDHLEGGLKAWKDSAKPWILFFNGGLDLYPH